MHAAELVRRVVDERRAKVVVMDVATYEEWRATLAFLSLPSHAQADVEAGRVCPHAEVFTELELELGLQET